MKIIGNRPVFTRQDLEKLESLKMRRGEFKISPFDLRSLERLKYMGDKGVFVAAMEFESILVKELLKGMNKTPFSGGSGIFGGSGNSGGGWLQFYSDLQNEVLSRQVSFGLADFIAKSMYIQLYATKAQR
jgi:Rod binding domain-containing protein